MSEEIFYITAWSILLPLVISIMRFKKIGSDYRSFIFLIWFGVINQLMSHFMIDKGYSNSVPSNIYSLIEAIFIVWLFYKRHSSLHFKKICLYLLTFFFISWLIENAFIGKFGVYFNSYFNIISALPIVLISINVINEIIVKEKDLQKNSLFLLCTAFIVYFTYRILIEVFWLYGQNISEGFMNRVFDIHAWINLVCNIIFAFAILWMQKRQAFTLRYS